MVPSLVITADQSKMQSVEKARAYHRPNSRLAVIRSYLWVANSSNHAAMGV
jgi:hypothetical protein